MRADVGPSARIQGNGVKVVVSCGAGKAREFLIAVPISNEQYGNTQMRTGLACGLRSTF
jgi:hypothetical protein